MGPGLSKKPCGSEKTALTRGQSVMQLLLSSIEDDSQCPTYKQAIPKSVVSQVEVTGSGVQGRDRTWVKALHLNQGSLGEDISSSNHWQVPLSAGKQKAVSV